MEFRHIILFATVTGLVILGVLLAILLCFSNEQDARLKIIINQHLKQKHQEFWKGTNIRIMEFWHIILLATVIGIVILGTILAILFCCNNEQDTQNPQEIYRRYDVENQNLNLKQDNRRILILKKRDHLARKSPTIYFKSISWKKTKTSMRIKL